MTAPLLRVRDLAVHFQRRTGLLRRASSVVKAVDGVSFDLAAGTTLGLVGESGSGKSTTGRAILRLVEPTRGAVELEGIDLAKLDARALREKRRAMQMVFQDPYASLNPRMTVLDIVGEPLVVHGVVKTKREKLDRVAELIAKVGLSPQHLRRYPHEFSGGQRQRVGIARAIALAPKLVVADEPVSALDVSIQAQIVNVLADLQRDLGLAYVFIAHDLAVVRHLSTEIAVMYLGKIVERAPAEELFRAPLHPYTEALLAAVPVPDPRRARANKRLPLAGEVPDNANPPTGCAFHPRCDRATDLCKREAPALEARSGERAVACHHAESPAKIAAAG